MEDHSQKSCPSCCFTLLHLESTCTCTWTCIASPFCLYVSPGLPAIVLKFTLWDILVFTHIQSNNKTTMWQINCHLYRMYVKITFVTIPLKCLVIASAKSFDKSASSFSMHVRLIQARELVAQYIILRKHCSM